MLRIAVIDGQAVANVISFEFGTLPETISAIVGGDHWAEVGPEVGIGSAVVAGVPQPLPAPAQTTDEMWARIKIERDRRADTGGYGVDVGGVAKWFHSDQRSRSQQLGLVLLANASALGTAVSWKTMDGSFVTMTPALASAILEAAAINDGAIFAAAEAHKAAMLASADPGAYDFSAGWPPMFGDQS